MLGVGRYLVSINYCPYVRVITDELLVATSLAGIVSNSCANFGLVAERGHNRLCSATTVKIQLCVQWCTSSCRLRCTPSAP